jgi:hypothetical protein
MTSRPTARLISKRPETFLPDRWPAYYDKAQGPYKPWTLKSF